MALSDRPRPVTRWGKVVGRLTEEGIVELDDARDFLAGRAQGVLAVVDDDGFPHVTRIVYDLGDDDVVRISITDGRVKTRHLRARPQATLHVRGGDDWHWVSVVADAELSPVAAAPGDEVASELLRTYEAVAGPHDDPAEFRQAMVDDHRLVLRLHARRLYGQL